MIKFQTLSYSIWFLHPIIVCSVMNSSLQFHKSWPWCVARCYQVTQSSSLLLHHHHHHHPHLHQYLHHSTIWSSLSVSSTSYLNFSVMIETRPWCVSGVVYIHIRVSSLFPFWLSALSSGLASLAPCVKEDYTTTL